MLFHARPLVSTFVESPYLGKEMFCQSIYSIHLFVLNIYKYICLLMFSVGSTFFHYVNLVSYCARTYMAEMVAILVSKSVPVVEVARVVAVHWYKWLRVEGERE